MSRLETISDTSGTLAKFTYLGLGTVVVEERPRYAGGVQQPSVKLDYNPAGDDSLTSHCDLDAPPDYPCYLTPGDAEAYPTPDGGEKGVRTVFSEEKGTPITAAESRPGFRIF